MDQSFQVTDRQDTFPLPGPTTCRSPLEANISFFLQAATINSSSKTGIYWTWKLLNGRDWFLQDSFPTAAEEAWFGCKVAEYSYWTRYLMKKRVKENVTLISFFNFMWMISTRTNSRFNPSTYHPLSSSNILFSQIFQSTIKIPFYSMEDITSTTSRIPIIFLY